VSGRLACVALAAALLVVPLAAQQAPPDLSGAWAPYRGGRGADPKLAAPPATPILLKGTYKAAWDERRAAEDAATKRGEPLATPAVDCIPYGMPRMMSVALYPLEIIQRPTQVTMVTEAQDPASKTNVARNACTEGIRAVLRHGLRL